MQTHRLIAGVAFVGLVWSTHLYAQEGFFRCAGLGDAEVRTDAAAKRTGESTPQPVAGSQHALVIFARFKDDAVAEEAPAWREKLFDPALPGSLTHFYAAMSLGHYALDGVCLPRRYASDYPAAHYGDGRYGPFTREILMQVDGEVDFGAYDNDGPDGMPSIVGGVIPSGLFARNCPHDQEAKARVTRRPMGHPLSGLPGNLRGMGTDTEGP